MTELDLREFICKEVNISFAVISEHGVSDFSPSRTFCIEGKFINKNAYTDLLILNVLMNTAYDESLLILCYYYA